MTSAQPLISTLCRGEKNDRMTLSDLFSAADPGFTVAAGTGRPAGEPVTLKPQFWPSPDIWTSQGVHERRDKDVMEARLCRLLSTDPSGDNPHSFYGM